MPVKNPETPFFFLNQQQAYEIPAYSLKPMTSSLVLTTVIGLTSTDYIAFARHPAKNCTWVSLKSFIRRSSCSK